MKLNNRGWGLGTFLFFVFFLFLMLLIVANLINNFNERFVDNVNTSIIAN